MPNCLECGKPLGNRTTLCYACRAAGVEIEDAIDIDPAIEERIERFLIVSSIRCADCGDIHGSVTVDGETYTAEAFGIDTIEAWELEMDKEREWIRENESTVAPALQLFEDEWPRTIAAIREAILRDS